MNQSYSIVKNSIFKLFFIKHYLIYTIYNKIKVKTNAKKLKKDSKQKEKED